jgi:hypothetical protein
MRVEIKIPGTLEAYCIDERGDKRDVTDDLWLETYLCAVLRAYSYADDGSGESIKKIVGVRRFNPIPNTDAEHRFMEAAERLFFNGWQLGSDPEIQVPNLVSNHLTTGLLKYIKTTGRYASGINLFEKLRARDPEISSLLARVYLYADEEVKAVQLLHEAISDLPMDYALLDCQAEFLDKKGAPELALEVAKRAVVAAPSEFSTWARLASVYVSMEQWDKALLTLNSCPMFTYQDKDAPRLPDPLRMYLPTMPESVCDEIDDRDPAELEHIHPTLRKLHAGNFKGTFLKAYMLLTEITTKIGWDQLLRIRSQVFVMEEEYKTEKQTLAQPIPSRNSSTTALRSPSPDSAAQLNGDTDVDGSEDGDDEAKTNGKSSSPAESKPTPVVKTGHLSPHHSPRVRPKRQESDDPSSPTATRLQHKRLCERWLDNLFMVLYEDLRVYTIWRTEVAQCRQQGVQYRKSAEEFEILGELAERLHHPDEAVEAYQNCLMQRFSPKSLRGVVNWYEKRGDARNVVAGVIRLVCWQYRWYSEVSTMLVDLLSDLLTNISFPLSFCSTSGNS